MSAALESDAGQVAGMGMMGEPETDDYLTILDALDFGILLTSPRCERIYFSNATASRVLAEFGGVGVPGAIRDAIRTSPAGAAFTMATKTKTPSGKIVYVRSRQLARRSGSPKL